MILICLISLIKAKENLNSELKKAMEKNSEGSLNKYLRQDYFERWYLATICIMKLEN